MTTAAQIFNHPIFIIVSGVSAIVLIGFALWSIYLVMSGVIPVWYRLGFALSKNKIAVFAGLTEFDNIKTILTDSGLFKEKNIVRIDQTNIKKAKAMNLFVLHWDSFQKDLGNVLDIKDDSVGLIVYAPQTEKCIEEDAFKQIRQNRNTTVVNFNGRFLLDVFVAMITTKRTKK